MNIVPFWIAHKWSESFRLGVFSYRECTKCGKRTAVQVHNGYSPMAVNWLEGLY